MDYSIHALQKNVPCFLGEYCSWEFRVSKWHDSSLSLLHFGGNGQRQLFYCAPREAGPANLAVAVETVLHARAVSPMWLNHRVEEAAQGSV